MSEVKRYKAMVNTPDSVIVADVYLSEDFDRIQAENQALQASLTVQDQRVDELEAEVKRLDLMVSQGDYNYDADRAQFKSRIADLSADNQHLRKLLEQAMAAVNPTKRLAKAIKSALNPTAEAASHDE